MAGSTRVINLDSLIMEPGDSSRVLKISEDTPPSSHHGSDDSDSSYSELARDTARKIDTMITEAQIEDEERSAKIRAGAEAKRKKLGGGQSSNRPKASNSHNGKVCFSDKQAGNADKIEPNAEKDQNFKRRNVKTNKKTLKFAGDEPSNISAQQSQPTNAKDQPAKPKSNKGNKKKFKKPASANQPLELVVEETSSKLKNVTVQEFDINSSDLSDLDDENVSDAKVFKVRRLNAKKESISVEESSSDEDAVPIHFRHSAEKNAAAQRRRRSGYLKKRHSDFKLSSTMNRTASKVNSVMDDSDLAVDRKSTNGTCQNDVDNMPKSETSGCAKRRAKAKKRSDKIIPNGDNSSLKQSVINNESSGSKENDVMRFSGKRQSNIKDDSAKCKDYDSSRLVSGKKQSNIKDDSAKRKDYDSSRLVSGKKQSNIKGETSKSNHTDSSRLVSGMKQSTVYDDIATSKDTDLLPSILKQLYVDDETNASSLNSKRNSTKKCENLKKSYPNFDSTLHFNECSDDVNRSMNLNDRCPDKSICNYGDDLNRVKINDEALIDDIKSVKNDNMDDFNCKDLTSLNYILGDDVTNDITDSMQTLTCNQDIIVDMASSDDDVDFATMVNSLSTGKGPLVEFKTAAQDGDDSSDLDAEFNAQLSRF